MRRRRKPRLYRGVHLPAIRSNEGLGDDDAYLASAMADVEAISQYKAITPSTRILDFGCGQGRLANGLILAEVGLEQYCGVDTNAESISWCERWIAPQRPNFRFVHAPAHNARYNPDATGQPPVPVQDDFFDLAFLNSVFSHMLEADVAFYARELFSKLRGQGVMYATAFVEEDVPDVEENPEGYLGKTARGPLHRVRFEKTFFLSLIEGAGFEIADFQYRGNSRSAQSVVVGRKA